MKKAIFTAVLFLFFITAAQAAVQKTELIQSIPSETPLAHPSLKFASSEWVEMIRIAKHSIDIAQFYSSSKKGKALEPIIEELRTAAKRGVKIRFLISADLVKAYQSTVDELKSIPGVDFAIYDISKISNGGILHAKYWILDGKRAYVGSQNFDWRAITEIHELGVLTENTSIVKSLKQIYEYDWKLAHSKNPKSLLVKDPHPTPKSSCETKLVASPPQLTPKSIANSEDELVVLISSAKKTLQVQLLNYTPVEKSDPKYWPVIDNALRSAAARGVKVSLLVSDWNMDGPGAAHLKSLAEIPNIEVKVATIPQVSAAHGGPIAYGRVIHSKYMVVDDHTLWLGTSNWSEDYFRNSRNVELIFCEESLAKEAKQVYDKLWSSDYSVDVRKAKGSTLYKNET